MTIKLYRHPLSGHSHRVELFLSLLGLPFEKIDVDLTKQAHRQPDFLAKNFYGQVPVIEDGEITIADSNAILVYLALRYDQARQYYPSDPVGAAKVQRWLSLAAGDLANGPAFLRLSALFRMTIDRQRPETLSTRLLTALEGELQQRSFLLGEQVTLADLAMYTYSAHAPEGGVSLEPYPAVQRWIARVEALPKFVGMQRVPAAAAKQ